MNCKLGDIAVIVNPPHGMPTDANIGRFVKISRPLGMWRYRGVDHSLFTWQVEALGGPMVSHAGVPVTAGHCVDLILRPIRGETQTEIMLDAAHG